MFEIASEFTNRTPSSQEQLGKNPAVTISGTFKSCSFADYIQITAGLLRSPCHGLTDLWVGRIPPPHTHIYVPASSCYLGKVIRSRITLPISRGKGLEHKLTQRGVG